MRAIYVLSIVVFCNYSLAAKQYSKASLDSFAKIEIPTIISKAEALIPLYSEIVLQQKENKLYYNEAKCYNALRLMHAYLGRYDSASYYSALAYDTYDKHGYEKEKAYLLCEGGYSAKTRNIEEAEQQMLQGLALLKKLKDKQGLGSQYNNYGVIKEMKNQYDSAGYYYQLSLDYKIDVKDSVGIPYSIMNLGTLAGLQNNFSTAQKKLTSAARIFEAQENVSTAAECYFELAEIEYKSGSKEASLSLFDKTIRTAQAAGYKRLILAAYNRLAQIYEETGNLKASLVFHKKSIALKDTILNELSVSETLKFEAKFKLSQKEKRIAQQQLLIKERNNQMLIGFIILGFLGFGIFYYIKRLRFKKKLEKIAYENKMREERERISRDLHDNIGSQLAFIVSGADLVKEDKEEQLAQIALFAKDTLNQLRTTVWAIKKEQITLHEFADQVEIFIEKIKPNSLIEFKLQRTIKNNLVLSPTQSIHLFRIIQESISNAIKHSECYCIDTSIIEKHQLIHISVKDDGVGFESNSKELGNGLQYMQQRLEEIHGTLDVKTSSAGTIVNCYLPINTPSVV